VNRRIVFLTLIGLMAAGLLLSACATDDAPGPHGDVGPKGPLGPRFADEATSVGTRVGTIGLGLALGILGSVVIIRARKSSRSVADAR
jgi:hypothetical protein